MSFLGKLEGTKNDGIAKMVGNKVGEAVEDAVKNVMSGNKKGGDAAAKGSSDSKGGFNTGDVLSLVGGGKKDDKGGAGLSDVLGAFK